MASFRQIRFYVLLLSGLAISVIAIYVFFTSTITSALIGLSRNAYIPSAYQQILGNFAPTPTSTVVFTNSAGQKYGVKVSVASTDKERQQGLMGVSSLPQDQGMLFIFQDGDQLRNFWMKDTKIPLDMIFLDSNKQIVHIENNVPPCTTSNCTIYSSGTPATYVIEVNGGWSQSHNIQVGNTAIF